MEFLEIITDLYFALGSAFSSVSDKFRNYNKIMNLASIGSDATYTYLTTFNELDSTIKHEKQAKILLVDQITNKNSEVYIHCILLDFRRKYINSLTLKETACKLPSDIFPMPKYWNI